MKRTAICFVLCLFLLCGQAAAEEIALPDALERAAPQVADLVNGDAEDSFGLTQGATILFNRALTDAKQYLLAGIRSLASILVGVVLLGLLESVVGEGVVSRRTELVGALYLTTVSAGDINTLIGLGRNTIENVSSLSKVLIPSLAAATAATGGITAASVRQVATVFFTDVLLTSIDRILIPILYVFIACAVASTVVDSDILDGIASLIKKITGWALGILLSLFTAYLSVSGAIASAVDAQAVRVAKTAVSTVVPVVGGILADAAETILAGAGILRAMIGVFGALGVIALCALPFLRLGTQYLLYQAAVFVAQVAGPKKLANMLKLLADAFALILAMTGAAVLLLLIALVSTLTVVVT